MDWNVKNAVNRDVERQHLNKILKEIQAGQTDLSEKVTATSTELTTTQNNLTTVITRVINNTIPPENLVTDVTLTGDVSGTSSRVDGQNAVTINTVLNKTFLEDAPSNASAYWRRFGQWEPVDETIYSLTDLTVSGFTVWDEENLEWTARSITSGSSSRVVVTDGDGLAGNPVIDLAEVPDAGTGVLQRTQFDVYGRKTGTAAATTDNLTEGTTNLYFTTERAQDAVGSALLSSADIEFTYNDVANTITAVLTAAVNASLDLADSAIQPGDPVTDLANNAGYLTYATLKTKLVAGANVTFTYDDTAQTITIAATGGGAVTYPITVAQGGTGATTAAAALINLGANLYIEKATAPVTADFGRAPINGDEWWNTTNGVLNKRVDGAWVAAGGPGNTPSYKVPAVLTTGVASNISLNADRTIPALLTNGAAASIPTVT